MHQGKHGRFGLVWSVLRLFEKNFVFLFELLKLFHEHVLHLRHLKRQLLLHLLNCIKCHGLFLNVEWLVAGLDQVFVDVHIIF